MLKSLSRPSALLVVAALLASPSTASARVFKVDTDHTSVTFKIRHFVTKVQGHFGGFEGTVVFDPDARESVKVDGSIDVATIDTNNEKRDKHLRSEDFFDVERFPKITFSGGKLTDVNADKTAAKLHGELTMHGVTKPVVLDVAFNGTATTRFGELKAGVTVSTTLDRKAFGIVWNKTLDAGGLMLGDTVEVLVEAELTEQEDATD